MTSETEKADTGGTPNAIELDEQQLDQASGGSLLGDLYKKAQEAAQLQSKILADRAEATKAAAKNIR